MDVLSPYFGDHAPRTFYAQGICFMIAISMSEAVFHQNPTCYWSSVLIPVNIARFKCKLSRAGTLDI